MLLVGWRFHWGSGQSTYSQSGGGSKSRHLERVRKPGGSSCFLCPNLESHAASLLSHFFAQDWNKTAWFEEEETDSSLNVGTSLSHNKNSWPGIHLIVAVFGKQSATRVS